MTRRQKLSSAELEVAQAVWKLGTARVRDVVAALPAGREVDASTVQTYLRRLKAKGYVRTRREGRADVYLPAAKPAGVIRDVVRDLIDRVFNGDALPLVQHLIDDDALTDEQIAQLQAKLDAHRERRPS